MVCASQKKLEAKLKDKSLLKAEFFHETPESVAILLQGAFLFLFVYLCAFYKLETFLTKSYPIILSELKLIQDGFSIRSEGIEQYPGNPTLIRESFGISINVYLEKVYTWIRDLYCINHKRLKKLHPNNLICCENIILKSWVFIFLQIFSRTIFWVKAIQQLFGARFFLGMRRGYFRFVDRGYFAFLVLFGQLLPFLFFLQRPFLWLR